MQYSINRQFPCVRKLPSVAFTIYGYCIINLILIRICTCTIRVQAAQESEAADCSAPDLARAQSLPSDAAVRQVSLQHWASRLAHCLVFTIQKHATVHEQFQCCGPRVRAFTYKYCVRSSKFTRKLKYVYSIDELADLIPLDYLYIPEQILLYGLVFFA